MNKNDIPKEIWLKINKEYAVEELDRYWYMGCEANLGDQKYIHEDEVKKIIQISIRCHVSNTKSDEKIIDEVLDNFKVDFNLETIVDLREQIKELENRLKLYEFIFSINKFDELEKKSKCWDKLKQEANSHFITVGEMTDIEQEVEADESKPQI